jgi:glutaminase
MQSASDGEILPTESRRDDALRIQQIVDLIYQKYRGVDDGEVATYIPELGKADPNDFGICLATADGRMFRAGDCNKEFTIQSMSKPFAFQIALEECGVHEVFKRVGVEPSGDAFNSIELDAKTSRPFNPMINAGAIAISSLIKKDPVGIGIQQFVDRMSNAAGRQLRIDYEVMRSETLTGNRNRAIAYLMRNFQIIDEYLHESLQQYCAQCSVLVTCEDMAIVPPRLRIWVEIRLPASRSLTFNI